jgi:tetratricopeptide (TPR) repeat protein
MFEIAKKLIDEEKYQEALEILHPAMEADPDSPLGLFLFGQILLASEKSSIAYHIFRRVTELDPKRPEGWINYGKAAGELHKYDLEEKFFKKALSLSDKESLPYYIAVCNLGTAATHQCNPDKVFHWANKALDLGDNPQSHIDLGYAHLMNFNFEDGWREYEYGNGFHKSRNIKNYAGEPMWDGERDKSLIIYGEQGIGDQILFSEAVTDARKRSKRVILHVNKKLTGLLSRSFLVEAYGYEEEFSTNGITASCSMSSLQRILRSNGYSGKPFLVADIQRRIQWRALLDSLPKRLNVGIAWTGGVHDTNVSERSTSLDTLLPILSQDVNWINLEYKDRTDEIKAFEKNHGIKVHDFSWALRTNDYDDTAALVNELDLVISVPTSIVHLAGGLGIPTWCVVNPLPNFVFGIKGDSMPYYSSVRLFRRSNDWNSVISEIGENLSEVRYLH